MCACYLREIYDEVSDVLATTEFQNCSKDPRTVKLRVDY